MNFRTMLQERAEDKEFRREPSGELSALPAWRLRGGHSDRCKRASLGNEPAEGLIRCKTIPRGTMWPLCQ
eukprot:9472172-Pyramimonas_sp.AAC.1